MTPAISLIHFAALRSVNGLAATVTRGVGTCSPTIVLARTDAAAITNREATYSAESQDILVAMADYTLGEPQSGDRFTYVEGTETVVTEARPPSGNEKCFIRWNGGAVFRIHTKVQSRTPV